MGCRPSICSHVQLAPETCLDSLVSDAGVWLIRPRAYLVPLNSHYLLFKTQLTSPSNCPGLHLQRPHSALNQYQSGGDGNWWSERGSNRRVWIWLTFTWAVLRQQPSITWVRYPPPWIDHLFSALVSRRLNTSLVTPNDCRRIYYWGFMHWRWKFVISGK